MQEHALTEKDLSLYYNIYGEGEPVVLIHGFGEDSYIWSSVIEGLQDKYRLIVPDLRGSGRSTGDMTGTSMDSLADDIVKVLDKENVTECTMIGHSMGGYITLAFAEKYGDRLKSFGLFHSTAFPDNDEKKQVRKKNVDFIKKHGSPKFIGQAVPNLFAEQNREKYKEIITGLIQRYSTLSPISLVAYTEAMMDRPDRTETLRTFGRPVLLIAGEYDTAVPIEQSMKMCQIADFAYIYIATQSGHMGMLEEPEFCLKAILDFLSGR